MNVADLVRHVNLMTDEDFAAQEVVQFLNDAMARINSDMTANFPYLSVENTEQEPVFPEKWQRLLLCTFAAGRIKENDSSQFEYVDWYSQFEQNLTKFISGYDVPEEYKDTSATPERQEMDFSNNPYNWTGGW